SASGCLIKPNASTPIPDRKSASAIPAEEICASAAPTNTIRRSTTYTPSTEQASAITSEPYSASRKRRMISIMRLHPAAHAPGQHDPVSAYRGHFDRDAIEVAQHLLAQDLVDGADAEPALGDERDAIHVV